MSRTPSRLFKLCESPFASPDPKNSASDGLWLTDWMCSLDSQMYAGEDFNTPYWGTFKFAADALTPTEESELYSPTLHDTYDSNWREFIGYILLQSPSLVRVLTKVRTQLIQVLAEFEELLPTELVKRMVHSLEIASAGAIRRNGTFPEEDDLVIGYSNIQLMRNLLVGWTGERLNNQTFIDFARHNGDELFALFSREGANTLGEYNSPVYAGISQVALGMHLKYGPKDSPLTVHAGTIVNELWKDIAQRYNPFLGNLAGPYDRAYCRDGTIVHVAVAMFWWGLFGEEYTPSPPRGETGVQYNLAQGSAAALIMDAVLAHVDDDSAEKVKQRGAWAEARSLNRTVWDDVVEDRKRFATSWISAPLQIGGETVNEEVARNGQFVPAIVHWASDPKRVPYAYNGLIMLYPTTGSIMAEASESSLYIAYPNATQEGADRFVFSVANIPHPWINAGNTVTGLEHLPCLEVNVTTTPEMELQPVRYGESVYDHYIYNMTYLVPENFDGVPSVQLDLSYTCEV